MREYLAIPDCSVLLLITGNNCDISVGGQWLTDKIHTNQQAIGFDGFDWSGLGHAWGRSASQHDFLGRTVSVTRDEVCRTGMINQQ
jgi:hypothetical protein